MAALGAGLAAHNYPGEVLGDVLGGTPLVVVILGGLGTLVGPLIGAAFFVVLKHEVGAITPYWHLITGLVLIAVVMSRANGIFGAIEAWAARRRMARRLQPLAEEVPGNA